MTRITGRRAAAGEPRFDVDVPETGYRWWYVDGISEDGSESVVVIAFIGSVFSPYYFRARARGRGDPLHFCALNIGLYRRRGKRWAMTERGRGDVERARDSFGVGPSRLSWQDDHLLIEIRERSAPFAQPVTGRIILRPDFVHPEAFLLDTSERHSWQPLAPSARIEVDMREPGLRWQGHGYFDTNAGALPLETDFRRWNWSRGQQGSDTSITYAVTQSDGRERELALRFAAGGRLDEVPVPAEAGLPDTGWRVERRVRSDGEARVLRTLEDTPFYARSLLELGNAAGPAVVMHESLDLERFRAAWVRALLPFRMPRIARS